MPDPSYPTPLNNLLDRLRDAIRLKHDSNCAEKTHSHRARNNKAPSIFGRRFFSGMCLRLHHWPELIPVYDHPPLIAVLADAAGDHLYRHANLHRAIAQIG